MRGVRQTNRATGQRASASLRNSASRCAACRLAIQATEAHPEAAVSSTKASLQASRRAKSLSASEQSRHTAWAGQAKERERRAKTRRTRLPSLAKRSPWTNHQKRCDEQLEMKRALRERV